MESFIIYSEKDRDLSLSLYGGKKERKKRFIWHFFHLTKKMFLLISKPITNWPNYIWIVLVHFRATGGAPLLRKTKFRVKGTHQFATVIDFLRKQLHLKDSEALYVYCNAAFSPSPESYVGDLHQCFQVGGELIVNYCKTDAWGWAMSPRMTRSLSPCLFSSLALYFIITEE